MKDDLGESLILLGQLLFMSLRDHVAQVDLRRPTTLDVSCTIPSANVLYCTKRILLVHKHSTPVVP